MNKHIQRTQITSAVQAGRVDSPYSKAVTAKYRLNAPTAINAGAIAVYLKSREKPSRFELMPRLSLSSSCPPFPMDTVLLFRQQLCSQQKVDGFTRFFTANSRHVGCKACKTQEQRFIFRTHAHDSRCFSCTIGKMDHLKLDHWYFKI